MHHMYQPHPKHGQHEGPLPHPSHPSECRCSIYCPTPSMASMVVNHFKMRTDIQAYHLGGVNMYGIIIGLGRH